MYKNEYDYQFFYFYQMVPADIERIKTYGVHGLRSIRYKTVFENMLHCRNITYLNLPIKVRKKIKFTVECIIQADAERNIKEYIKQLKNLHRICTNAVGKYIK